ncbi:membrane magnesium transporter-domain-containing protein [Powellomyces hirtus]|nr:membrane magnesium transporter-domain-containing protein [Powellomyces hirtus]
MLNFDSRHAKVLPQEYTTRLRGRTDESRTPAGARSGAISTRFHLGVRHSKRRGAGEGLWIADFWPRQAWEDNSQVTQLSQRAACFCSVVVAHFTFTLTKANMTSWIGRLIYSIGALLLVHSGYSAFEHVAYLKTVGKAEGALPSDIILECLTSVLFCMAGISLVSGDLKPISLVDEVATLSMDSIDARPSFRTMHHRGTALFALGGREGGAK